MNRYKWPAGNSAGYFVSKKTCKDFRQFIELA